MYLYVAASLFASSSLPMHHVSLVEKRATVRCKGVKVVGVLDSTRLFFSVPIVSTTKRGWSFV